MSDQKATDKSEHLPKAPDTVLQNADAQDARNSGKAEIVSAEKLRTNQSDGSLRRYSGVDLSDQDQSIEITYGEKSTSKTNKLTEAELLQCQKKAALEAQSQTIEEMRQAVKTTPALEPILALREHAQSLPPSVEKDKYRDLALSQAKEVSPDMAAYLNARDRSSSSAGGEQVLSGRVTENHFQGNWQLAIDELGKLPLDKQISILAVGFTACYKKDVDRFWGRLIGGAEGLGAAFTSVATVVDFGGAVLWNDKKVASELADKFGTDIATITFSGIRLYAATDKCLFDTGFTGDYSLPFRQVAATGLALDEQWAALPLKEQERIKYRLLTEFAAEGAMGAGAAQAVGKAKTFTGLLDVLAQNVVKSGAGTFDRSRKALAGAIREFCTPDYSYAGIGRLKLLQDTKDELMEGLSNEKRLFRNPYTGNVHTPGEAARNAGIDNTLKPKDKAKALIERGWQLIEPKAYFVEGLKQPLNEAAAAKHLGITKENLRRLTRRDLQDHGVTSIEPIDGSLPINWEYAGSVYKFEGALSRKYPNGVRFEKTGFPDFSPYVKEVSPRVKASVDLELTGSRTKDFRLANRAMGWTSTPIGWVWHHHENAKTLQLIPRALHRAVSHTGGCATSGLDYID